MAEIHTSRYILTDYYCNCQLWTGMAIEQILYHHVPQNVQHSVLVIYFATVCI